MASIVRSFAVLTPAGTTAASPLVTDLTMPARLVRWVRIRVPPGPAGQLGIALTSNRQWVIPEVPSTWLVFDNETVEWELQDQIETGAWQLRSYNTGRWDHTAYLTFGLDPLPVRTGLPGSTVPITLEA